MPSVASKSRFLDAAVDARLFESFQRRCLGMSQPRLGAALGESPASAAGLYQQEFNAADANPVADCSDLLASPQLVEVR